MGRELAGIGLLMLAAMAFGSLGVLARAAFAGGATPLSVLVVRYAVAAGTLWPILLVRWRGGSSIAHHARRRPRQMAVLLALGVLNAATSLGILVGLERLPVGTAILLFYTYPALVALLSFVLGERATRRKLGALALALAGVALTVGLHVGGWDSLGVAAVLLAASTTALFIVASGRAAAGLRSLLVTAYVLAGAAAVFAVAGVLGRVNLALSPAAWAACAAIGLVCTVVAMGALVAGIARVGPTRAAIISTLEPLVAIVLAAIFLGERLEPGQLLGGALILSAVLLLAPPEKGAPSTRLSPTSEAGADNIPSPPG
jgi:drug/metabolite transporter (DMT)-like permease